MVQEEIDKQPHLVLGQLRAPLYAYRITDKGILFVELSPEDKPAGKGEVHFTTNGFVLNVAGDSFRDDEVGHLVAQNALRAM